MWTLSFSAFPVSLRSLGSFSFNADLVLFVLGSLVMLFNSYSRRIVWSETEFE